MTKETEDRHGGLVLTGSSLTLTVTRQAVVEAGDHDVVLLRVLDLHRDPAAPPLVPYNRTPHHAHPPTDLRNRTS